jgi:hypothetical protein
MHGFNKFASRDKIEKKKNEGIESTLVSKRVYESFTVPKLVMEAN